MVQVGRSKLTSELTLPADGVGVVLFALGGARSHRSGPVQRLAQVMQQHHLATLLCDLLTDGEGLDGRNRCDIGLLARRVLQALEWVVRDPRLAGQRCGLFGAGTGAAAALVAAATRPGPVAAIVLRSGCPQLAADRLPDVRAPTLLLVGGEDHKVLEFNRASLRRMHCKTRLEVIPGARRRFDEAGALDTVAELSAQWMEQHLRHDLVC